MTAARLPIFISYSRHDNTVVERLRADLHSAGLPIWIDRIGLQPGTPDWDEALRLAISQAGAVLLIASPSSRRSPYVRDEVALARDAGKPIYPLWVDGDKWLDCVPLGFGSTQNLDLRGEGYAAGLARLIGALTGTAAPLADESTPVAEAAPPPAEPRNPYKGLRAFREADQGDFFGRESLIADLVTALGDGRTAPRLRAVLGASGSGKSSVMMAGLLPKLRNGAIPGSENWIYLDPMTPGAHPLERLTITLARHMSAKSQAVIREDLDHRSMRGLHRLASEMADKPVVLYIDQFEEVFTLTTDEAERRQFIDLLTAAVTEPDGVLLVLLTMRADFYDRPAAYGEFAALLESQHTLIKPMALADLYDVVQKPAQLPDARLTFDDGLVTEMVFAVREEAGSLPLLQFTLDQLFQKRAGSRLTRAAYDTLGGVRGALAGHAEAIWQGLSDEQQSLARGLFLRLIEPGVTPQDATRRRARRGELTLTDAEQTEQMRTVIDTFVNARLLTADRVGDDETIEVSHEALIREWPQLQNWLRDTREDMVLQKKISADTAGWVRDGRQPDYGALYGGRVLREAESWAARHLPSADEVAFLEAGVQRQAQLEALEESRKRELNKAAERAEKSRRDSLKAARQARTILMGLIAVAALGVAAFFIANAQYVASIQDLGIRGTAVAAQATYFGLEQSRISTLSAGGVIVSVGTQTPGIFEPTMTQIAVLNAHDPTLPENNMIDESGVAMVRVPAGCFFMGSYNSIDEQPVHEICFDEPFWMDKTEVTQGDFERLDGQKAAANEISGENRPVENITWFEARDFCALRGARLPTEAEWEYAVRGPDSLVYPWGNEFVGENVIYGENSEGQTADVGGRPAGASWVGALDMSGNVYEWVASIYKAYPYAAADGRNNDDNRTEIRVLRGGSWVDLSTINLRTGIRYRGNPDSRASGIGFRCARSP